MEIGWGSFAVVYRAHDARFDRTVAIKVLGGRLDERRRERFERERRAMGVVSRHPNCVTVFDSGFTDEGSPYIVMEDMTGGSLADRIVAGPLPWREAVAMAVGLAGALQTAHQSGVLHRDVKPENVLLSEFGEWKLADFGIAHVEGRTMTGTGRTPFTPLHAAPEVLDGQRASVASDVYSLGSTLFGALSGSAPFARPAEESTYALVARVLRDPPPELRAHGVPDTVFHSVEAALAKQPQDRPASAAAFGQRLQDAQVAAGEPVTRMVASQGPDAAEPDERDTAAHRRPRRRWLVGLGAIALAAAIALVTFLWLRDDGATTDARDRERATADAGAPGEDRPRLTIDVGTRPDGIAIGPDGVWVANRGDNSVALVAPLDGSVSSTVDVGDEPSGVAVGQGAVWVANSGEDYVSKIDPSSAAVTATIAVGDSPAGIDVGPDGVWVANSSDRTVSRIDPATNAEVARITVGNDPVRVAVTPSAVWVTNYTDGTVSRIDPTTNAVVTTVDVGGEPVGVAADDDAAWVTSLRNGTVVRIDAASNTVSERIRVGRGPTDVTIASESVWVVNSRSDTVTQIDAATSAVVSTIRVGPQPLALDVREDEIWVVNYLEEGTLSRVSV